MIAPREQHQLPKGLMVVVVLLKPSKRIVSSGRKKR